MDVVDSGFEFPSSRESERIKYPEIDTSSVSVAAEESDMEDKVFVAVSKNVKQNKSTIIWALQNSRGRKICIIHVHQPPQLIPTPLGKIPASSVTQKEVEAYHERERQTMNKMLDDCISICARAGVRAEKLFIETESIEKGIIELVSQHGIRKLVMGAAADSRFSRRMIEPKSKKANYVRQNAPDSCHIWFVCKGLLIYTREGMRQSSDDRRPPCTSKPKMLSSHSNIQSDRKSFLDEEPYSRARFGSTGNIYDAGEYSAPQSRLEGDGSSDECDQLPRTSIVSISESSGPSPLSDGASSSPFSPFSGTRELGDEFALLALRQTEEVHHVTSPPSVLERNMNEELYDQLEQAMTEAETSRREAFEESTRRRKAEKAAIEAIRKAKTAEDLFSEEMRRKREIREELTKGQLGLEKLKSQQKTIHDELNIALGQKSELEGELEKSNLMVKDLEEKIFSAVELLQNYKKERDELQTERDNALRVAEELRKQLTVRSSATYIPKFFSEFSLLEIEKATNYFDPAMKIGEGGYGSIYRGLFRHTEIAIKMLHPDSLQGPQEYQQEVDVLSKLRHPNIVTLIGACPEAWALIYEYLPNGSLEDRLSCKGNSPPLSWQTRIRIAAELCSVLIFLHSSKPNSIVHGDLKPANVLLDANFVCKLGDFGICRVIAGAEMSSSNTKFCRTDPKGTFAYMDPEFLTTGELTPESDVYSFGIILLRLLTGKQALGISREVQYALNKDNLNVLLDSSAGDWPFVWAKQLAHLALRCCEMSRKGRPELVSEVWRVLEPMRVSCGNLSSLRLGGEDNCTPSYFICPIFQEVMQDPQLAADGFTYEAEALRGWLESGHENSPMTNMKLSNYDLIPNRALRSAIQEWMQQQKKL